tara:strand:+ start:16 stop:639 length:624 start_codon:yes stop_codon:yes gene_type:complete
MKNFFYIILFLPFLSIAQNDITPKIACDLINDYERAKEFTLKYLNTMPANKYSYKPTPEILSFREEALHLAGGNYRYAAMIAGGYDASNFDEIFKRPELQTKEGVIAWVDKSYDVMINQIKNEENLEENTYYYRWNCSKNCLARKGFEHQSHHRGKWAIYLRLVGEIPPGEQLIWKDQDSNTPRDISREDWQMTPNYKKYKKIIDKN